LPTLAQSLLARAQCYLSTDPFDCARTDRSFTAEGSKPATIATPNCACFPAASPARAQLAPARPAAACTGGRSGVASYGAAAASGVSYELPADCMMASVVEALHCAGGAAASSTPGDGSDCGTAEKCAAAGATPGAKRRGFDVGRGGGIDGLAGGGTLGIAGTGRSKASVRGGSASNGAKPC
jgi:hypothetical protein